MPTSHALLPSRLSSNTEVAVELHTHSPLIPGDWRGDPSTSAQAVVETAASRNIRLLALTDHWTVAFVPALREAARRYAEATGTQVEVLPGLELRIRYGSDEAHLLAIFGPKDYQKAVALLLTQLGLPDPAGPLWDLPTLAHTADPLEVAALIDELGGLCLLAHVDRWFGHYRLADSPLARDIASSPHVAAVEVIEASSLPRALAQTNAVFIQSSDSHSLAELGVRSTWLPLPELSLAGVRHALQRLAILHGQCRTAVGCPWVVNESLPMELSARG